MAKLNTARIHRTFYLCLILVFTLVGEKANALDKIVQRYYVFSPEHLPPIKRCLECFNGEPCDAQERNDCHGKIVIRLLNPDERCKKNPRPARIRMDDGRLIWVDWRYVEEFDTLPKGAYVTYTNKRNGRVVNDQVPALFEGYVPGPNRDTGLIRIDLPYDFRVRKKADLDRFYKSVQGDSRRGNTVLPWVNQILPKDGDEFQVQVSELQLLALCDQLVDGDTVVATKAGRVFDTLSVEAELNADGTRKRLRGRRLSILRRSSTLEFLGTDGGIQHVARSEIGGYRRYASPKRVEKNFTGFTLAAEEDLFLIGKGANEDRNYTVGGALEFHGAYVRKSCLDKFLYPFDIITGIHRLRRFHVVNSHSFGLGFTMFTPDRLELVTPNTKDRPYSFLLYFSFRHLSVDTVREYSIETELDIGALGLRFSDKLQAGIHYVSRKGCSTCTPYDPKGWEHQISDGGEPTIRYGVRFEKLLTGSNFHQITANALWEVGYQTAATFGGGFRLGIVTSSFWESGSVSPVGSNSELVGLEKNADQKAGEPLVKPAQPPWYEVSRFEAYAFASGRTRFVLYNANLQGQFRHSDVTLGFNEIEHFLAEYDVGLALGVLGLNLSWMILSGRTAEFKGAGRNHQWGSAILSYRRLL